MANFHGKPAGFDILEVSLHNQASQIPLAHEALDQFASREGLPGNSVTRLHVALEEHLTNIISYGYEAGKTGHITIRFALESSVLRIEIADDARPFNPLEAPEVDTTLPLEDKPLGGLGLLMIRKSADELQYSRVNGQNVLTIKKRIE